MKKQPHKKSFDEISLSRIRELDEAGIVFNSIMPTLEELIDACGAKFWALEWVTNKKWVAHSFSGQVTSTDNTEHSIVGIKASGSNTKMAVSALLLALKNTYPNGDDENQGEGD